MLMGSATPPSYSPDPKPRIGCIGQALWITPGGHWHLHTRGVVEKLMKPKSDVSGALIPMYEIECGTCQRYRVHVIADHIDYVARTPEQAERILRRQGWKSLDTWGWVCPRCVAAMQLQHSWPDEPPRTKQEPL